MPCGVVKFSCFIGELKEKMTSAGELAKDKVPKSGMAHGLTADGVATPAVQQAIFGASASSGSSSGSSGGSSSGSGAVTAGTNATVNVGAGTTLNIREKASTSAKRIGRLKDGTRITILSTEGEWYRIEWNGLTGYVYGTCVRKD